MAAEEGTDREHRAAREAEQLAPARGAPAARGERRRVQRGRGQVRARVRQPNWAGAAVAVDGQGPIAQAAGDRRCGGHEADLDEALARAAGVIAAKQVEQRRAEERPDDHIRQRRMESVAEQCAG
jgi:hypothetical protein